MSSRERWPIIILVILHLFIGLTEKGEISLESPFGSVISVKSMLNLDGIVTVII